jgi:hypothetical protein
MTAPVRTKGKVVWGTINGFYAPVGTATPFDDGEDIDDPDSPWIGLPYTAEGFSRTYSREISEARVEEESNPIGKDITGTNWLVALMIAEDTIDNQAVAMGGDLTTVAASNSVIGHKKLTLSATLEEVALCLIMPSAYKKADGSRFKDLLYIPSVATTGDVETEYRRSPENKRTLPVTFEATCKLADIEIYSQTAVKTA